MVLPLYCENESMFVWMIYLHRVTVVNKNQTLYSVYIGCFDGMCHNLAHRRV